MGNVNGQNSNSLLSKRLKKITSERQSLSKKQEQPNSVVAKIERVLFAYRETLAYYQDILEQFEVEFKSNVREIEPVKGISTDEKGLQNLTDRLMASIQELEQKLQSFELAGANQLNAFQEASVSQLNTLENLLQQLSSISLHGANDTAATSMCPTEPTISGEREYDDMPEEDNNSNMETVKNEEHPETLDEDIYLMQAEAYSKNLVEIKKRLDDLMRFVGKVDGSIIEHLKSHTNENRDMVMEQLTELKTLTQKKNKGIKPLLVFNLFFGLINATGIVLLFLELLGIINL